MTQFFDVPEAVYGILEQDRSNSALDEVAEQLKRLGYAVLDSGYTAEELKHVSEDFDATRTRYISKHGESELKAINELHTIRLPLAHGGKTFLHMAFNVYLIAILKQLISGKFILNQQNGIVNPPREKYNQSAWHRDLPYQHFVSSRPLAINALFCVDDFTLENGATFVLPMSHKAEAFPSLNFIKNNAVQITAKAGQFILLDCMLFHAGGFNKTPRERRAVNHVFNIPYFKQQINIPINLRHLDLTEEQRDILGFNYMEPDSIASYLASRKEKY